MAMVQANERGSAAGVTSLARIVPFGISPTISTYLMQTVSLTLPLFIGGGLQLINDVAFFLMFRHVRPPEELAANQQALNSRRIDRMKKSREPTGAVSFLHRIAEQRILEAQREGAFDNLPGRGKPLELEDLSWVPEDLRIGYHVLKNAHVLPPEVELLKDIHSLEDLLKHVEDETERRSLAKSIQWKMIRLDMLKRRSLDLNAVRTYGRKLVAKFQLK